MYKYHVKIRGEKEPIILEGDRGFKLKQAYDSETIGKNDRVDFGEDASYTGDQIQGIKRIAMESYSGDFDNSIEENKRMRKEFLALPVEEKAAHLGIFKMMVHAGLNRAPTPEELLKAQEVQLEFYRNNPKRWRPDPNIFESIIPRENVRVHMYGGGLLRVVESLVIQDIRDMRFEK